MRKLFTFIGSFFAEQWRQFTPTGQMLFTLALIAIAVDAGIAWEYGHHMSMLHAAGFALVAVGLAVFPDIAAREFERGASKSGWTLGALCLPLAIVAYMSHIGYGAGIRLGDMQATTVQLARVDDVRKSLDSERTNIAMWREQLADLKKRNASHADKHKGWLVTVDPVAMQSQLDAMDERIKNEAARVKCAQKCEALKVQRGDLAALISAIKQENDLTDRIEATQRVLDAKTQVAADTKPKNSVVVNQNTALGDLFKLVTGHQAQASDVNLASMGNASLAFLLLAPAFMYAAGRNRKPEYMARKSGDDEPSAPVHADTPKPSPPAPAYVAPVIQRRHVVPSLHTTTIAQLRQMAAA